MGATGCPETHALTRLTRSTIVAADDRSARASVFSRSTTSESTAGGATQTASFAVGALRVDLIAVPGAARVVVASAEDRDVYVVEPAALASWARATKRLLSLAPAGDAARGAEYRAPFLIDREGRPAIAFEGLVTAQAVTFRLLVCGPESRVAGTMTTADIIRDVTDAASGAVTVALRATP
jgi:hypothetical protein